MANLSLNQNQFSQTGIIGMVTFAPQPSSFSAQLDPNSTWATPITAGQSVKLTTTSGPQVMVEPCAADTDAVFGVIAYNMRKNVFALGDVVTVVGAQGVMLMKTSAAVNRGAKVAITNQTVATNDPTVATQNTTAKAVTGQALETAAGANALIKVLINPSINP